MLYFFLSVCVVNCFIGGSMCKTPKKMKGGYCISIGVRFWGKFCGCVEPDLREVYDPIWNRIRGKGVIFYQVTHSASLGVWGFCGKMEKICATKSNTLNFERGGLLSCNFTGWSIGRLLTIHNPPIPH